MRLHDDAHALHTSEIPHSTGHYVAELLLSAQHVKACLANALAKKLDESVVARRLHAALKVDLHARRLMNGVVLEKDKAARVGQLHLAKVLLRRSPRLFGCNDKAMRRNKILILK